MIPSRLRLSGFLSYREPTELDFSQFELACISGANGAGKSSLLDAVTWALFGQARRRDDTIINNHKDVTAAEVEFEFYYENQLYRIQRTKPREKATILEFHVQTEDGNWKALTEHSLRETEQRIVQTLRMDYDVFTNASFFLQGRADQFAQQRPADRKRILSSILGLEIWETYQARAAQSRRSHEEELRHLDGQLVEITAELNEGDARRERLKQLEEELTQMTALRQAKEELLVNLRRLAATLEQQRRLVDLLASQESALQQRLENLESQRNQRQTELTAYTAELAQAAEVEAAYQRWQQVRTELESWDAVAASFRQQEQQRAEPLSAIQAEKARLEQEIRGLSARQSEIARDQSLMPGLADQLAVLQSQLAEMGSRLEQRASLEERIRTAQEDRASARAENERLKNEMKELKERIEQLKAAEGANCPLCGQPLSAEDRERLVDELGQQGKEMGDRYRANQELLRSGDENKTQLDTELTALQVLDEQHRARQREADQLAVRLDQIKTQSEAWAGGGALRLQEADGLLENGQFALEARDELASMDVALKELGYDAAAHDQVRREEQSLRASESRLRELETARARLEPLKREIASLEQEIATGQSELEKQTRELRQARDKYERDAAGAPDLVQAENEKFALQERENRLRAEVGGAAQKVEVLKALRKREKDLNAKRAVIQQRIGQFKTLERAFGKDGVPALLIEQALPEIETQANDILDRLSDGGMSVSFKTQRDFKDKHREDKKETLDILISDAAGSREYELYSGGEAFRINFAIRLALSRVLAQRSGARLQTLVIDEGFGSQDSEGRQRLIEAINLVKPDFAHIIVITHLEELKDAFPTRIEVEKAHGGSRIRLVL